MVVVVVEVDDNGSSFLWWDGRGDGARCRDGVVALRLFERIVVDGGGRVERLLFFQLVVGGGDRRFRNGRSSTGGGRSLVLLIFRLGERDGAR